MDAGRRSHRRPTERPGRERRMGRQSIRGRGVCFVLSVRVRVELLQYSYSSSTTTGMLCGRGPCVDAVSPREIDDRTARGPGTPSPPRRLPWRPVGCTRPRSVIHDATIGVGRAVAAPSADRRKPTCWCLDKRSLCTHGPGGDDGGRGGGGGGKDAYAWRRVDRSHGFFIMIIINNLHKK